MEIHSDEVIGYPREKVWEVMRDHLPDLVPFMNGLDSIEITEKQNLGDDKIRLLRLWHGNKEVAPKLVRPFLSESLLRLKDHSEWNQKEYVVEWTFETEKMNNLFECKGHNKFFSLDDQKTRVVIEGQLTVHADRVPGVPKFLARKIGPAIEGFVVKLLGENMKDMSKSIQKFLDQQ